MSVLTITVPKDTGMAASLVAARLINQLPRDSSGWIERKISTVVFTPVEVEKGASGVAAEGRFIIPASFNTALNEILNGAIKA